MNASKKIVKLIQQKQRENPGLRHADAYRCLIKENPDAVEDFLIEIGVKKNTFKGSEVKAA